MTFTSDTNSVPQSDPNVKAGKEGKLAVKSLEHNTDDYSGVFAASVKFFRKYL